MRDVKAMAADLVKTMREYVARALVSVTQRLDALEQRVAAIPAGAQGERGERGPPGAPGVAGAKGAPGESIHPDTVKLMIAHEVELAVARAVAAIPKAKDGERGPQGEPGPQGAPGAAGSPGEPGATGARGEKGETGAAGSPGEPGATGAAGERGEKGDAGRDGKDADIATLREIVAIAVKAAAADLPMPELDMHQVERICEEAAAKAVNAFPVPKDGRDGVDGLGFDDMRMDLQADGRTLAFVFTRNGVEKLFEVRAPWQLYRGLFKAGQRYAKGDVVTYAGSSFVANKDTAQPPETDDWTLCVKRGRDA